MELKWYLLFVKAHSEKKVSQILTRKRIENYCPLTESGHKNIEHPLISCHIFIKVAKEQHAGLKKLGDIINFVYWLGEPVVIKESEINIIRRFLSEYSHVKLERIAVNLNEAGKIVSHGFSEQQAQLIPVENTKVKAILPSIGYALLAERAPSKVRVISPLEKPVSSINFIHRIRIAGKQFAGYS